jgi:hypothetical protein
MNLNVASVVRIITTLIKCPEFSLTADIPFVNLASDQVTKFNI